MSPYPPTLVQSCSTYLQNMHYSATPYTLLNTVLSIIDANNDAQGQHLTSLYYTTGQLRKCYRRPTEILWPVGPAAWDIPAFSLRWRGDGQGVDLPEWPQVWAQAFRPARHQSHRRSEHSSAQGHSLSLSHSCWVEKAVRSRNSTFVNPHNLLPSLVS